MEIKLETIDRGEALRYLGYPPDRGPDARVAAQLAEAEAMVLRLARPRTVYGLFALSPEADGLRLDGTALALEGGDIRAHLAGCDRCFLMAATLGAELEGGLRRLQVTDMALAAILDALADAAIEQVCDQLQCELEGIARREGGYLTSRFSPGYGDMPLSQQGPVCAVLDTARRIGMTATKAHLLTPRKSVTAVLGVASAPRREAGPGCDRCTMRERCKYRKAGTTCVG